MRVRCDLVCLSRNAAPSSATTATQGPKEVRTPMPMLDAYIPEGALSPDAERELVRKITDALLEHEGVDPINERGRKLAWVFVHRPEVYVGGGPPKMPRYRFI